MERPRIISMPISRHLIHKRLAVDVFNEHGLTLVGKHALLTESLLQRLEQLKIDKIPIIDDPSPNQDKQELIHDAYQSCFHLLGTIIQELIENQRLSGEVLETISSKFFSIIHYDREVIGYLSQLMLHDDYTHLHCINTSIYCMLISKWLGLPEEDIKTAILAGVLHDIGKIAIPKEILNKRQRLTKTEFDVIKQHPLIGYCILSRIPQLDQAVSKAVLLHHERLDGSGYPLGLKADRIGMLTRILAIADVYDAMTSARAYKPGSTPFHAFAMFQTEGISVYDFSIVDVFMKRMIPYLTNATVLLSNGDLANVRHIPKHDILHPILMKEDMVINLAERTDIHMIRLLYV